MFIIAPIADLSAPLSPWAQRRVSRAGPRAASLLLRSTQGQGSAG